MAGNCTCKEQILHRKRWLCKRIDDRPPHQKDRFILANKGVGLSLDIWPSRKDLLQKIWLVLELLTIS